MCDPLFLLLIDHDSNNNNNSSSSSSKQRRLSYLINSNSSNVNTYHPQLLHISGALHQNLAYLQIPYQHTTNISLHINEIMPYTKIRTKRTIQCNLT
jgi:hypothetical protein